MSTIDAADLQNVELLTGFQPDELSQLASELILREFSVNQMVFSIGDTDRSLFIVLSGRVEIDLVGQIVDQTELMELGPGDVFGETTFFHAAAHHATARCLEATRIAELSYAKYEQLLKTNSAMAYHLGANAAHILAARLQATDAWIRDVLDRDEELHRHQLRDQYHNTFFPRFTTPTGFVGLGVNW